MSEIHNIKNVIKELRDNKIIAGNADIAKRMGYNRPGTISDNLKKDPLDDKFLALFCTTFGIPQERIRSTVKAALYPISNHNPIKKPKKNTEVPFHQDVTITTGLRNIDMRPTYLDLGGAFGDATGAMQVSGNDMYPTFESGCIIAFRELKNRMRFVPGATYIIGTEDFKIMRRLQPSDKPGHVLLLADNEEPDTDGKKRHREFELQLEEINFLAVVLGKITRMQMRLLSA